MSFLIRKDSGVYVECVKVQLSDTEHHHFYKIMKCNIVS